VARRTAAGTRQTRRTNWNFPWAAAIRSRLATDQGGPDELRASLIIYGCSPFPPSSGCPVASHLVRARPGHLMQRATTDWPPTASTASRRACHTSREAVLRHCSLLAHQHTSRACRPTQGAIDMPPAKNRFFSRCAAIKPPSLTNESVSKATRADRPPARCSNAITAKAAALITSIPNTPATVPTPKFHLAHPTIPFSYQPPGPRCPLFMAYRLPRLGKTVHQPRAHAHQCRVSHGIPTSRTPHRFRT